MTESAPSGDSLMDASKCICIDAECGGSCSYCGESCGGDLRHLCFRWCSTTKMSYVYRQRKKQKKKKKKQKKGAKKHKTNKRNFNCHLVCSDSICMECTLDSRTCVFENSKLIRGVVSRCYSTTDYNNILPVLCDLIEEFTVKNRFTL